MALELAFEAPTGDSYAAAYHRVTEIVVEPLERRVRVTVGTWRNRAAAVNGKTPVASRSVTWGRDDVSTDLLAAARAFVQAVEAELVKPAALLPSASTAQEVP